MELNELSYKIRGAIFQVHSGLGPGLFESVYQRALIYELQQLGMAVESQVALPVRYKETTLELGFRIDMLVEDTIIVELKSVESLHDLHKKQLLTYLKLADKRLGFLVNFNVYKVVDKVSLIRIVN